MSIIQEWQAMIRSHYIQMYREKHQLTSSLSSFIRCSKSEEICERAYKHNHVILSITEDSGQ